MFVVCSVLCVVGLFVLFVLCVSFVVCRLLCVVCCLLIDCDGCHLLFVVCVVVVDVLFVCDFVL